MRKDQIAKRILNLFNIEKDEEQKEQKGISQRHHSKSPSKDFLGKDY
jgi:hypothetical protein